MVQNTHLQIAEAIASTRQGLLNHPLYKKIDTLPDLHVFMRHHVYAVWDFMSLLKSLQQSLTCTTTPWTPVGDPELRYLINEIVLAEETDLNLEGMHQSHFEMYLDALQAAELDTRSVQQLIASLGSSEDIISSIQESELPNSIRQFLHTTFSIIKAGKPHEIAASFTYGREDLIPEMFVMIIKGLEQHQFTADLEPLHYYFQRHVELDGDEHGPMAHRMVAMLCGNDPIKIDEAAEAARISLKSRKLLFDGIMQEIDAQLVGSEAH